MMRINASVVLIGAVMVAVVMGIRGGVMMARKTLEYKPGEINPEVKAKANLKVWI